MLESFRVGMLKEAIKGQRQRNESIKANFLDLLNTKSGDMPAKEVLELAEGISSVIPVTIYDCSRYLVEVLDLETKTGTYTYTCADLLRLAVERDIGIDIKLYPAGLDHNLWEFPVAMLVVKYLVANKCIGFIYDW